MTRILSRCLLLLTLTVPLNALAAPEQVAEVIHDLRARGYPSATVALQRLRQADDVPTNTGSLQARLAYDSELWPLQMAAGRTTDLDRTLARLRHMATAEQCQACMFELALQQANAAVIDPSQNNSQPYLERARVLLPQGDARREQRLLALEGDLNNRRGYYNQGIDAMLRAASMADAAGDIADKLVYQNFIVAMNVNLRDLDRAQAMAEATLEAASKLDFRPVMAKVSVDLSYIASLKHQSERQRVALERALAISAQSPDLLSIQITSTNNLSDYYLAQPGQAQLAYDMAQRAYKLTQGTPQYRADAIALTNMGISSAKLGRTPEGIDLLRQAIDLSKRRHIDIDVVGISQELVTIYKNAGRYREALLLLQKVNTLQEEMVHRERDTTVLGLQEKYAAAGRTQEIRRLSAENAARASEIASKASQQRLWVVLAVAMALGLLLFASVIRRTRILNRKLAIANSTLTEQSMIDPLTRAFNRRHCHEIIARLHRPSPHRRQDDVPTASSGGLLLLDVDFFKHVNDTYGHAAGDAVLVMLVQRLHGLVRKDDVIARWGGEEFLLVLPHTPLAGVPITAQRVLNAVGQTPFIFNDTAINVTVSIGTVFLPALPQFDWEAAVGLADLALYQSKASGRNRATCLMDVAASVDPRELADDLMQAHAAGKVELQVVLGSTHCDAVGTKGRDTI